MKTIEFEDKTYSWLQWPVKLKHYTSPTAHITAKFFGDSKFHPLWIEEVLPRDSKTHGWPSKDFEWEPNFFTGGRVLELTKYPAMMTEIHEIFNGRPLDQFTPWRPHISVARPYWIDVDCDKRTPEDEMLTLGELELCLGIKNRHR